MWTHTAHVILWPFRLVSIPQSGFDPCGRNAATHWSENGSVSIPQSGFDPCGQRPRRTRSWWQTSFNPSVGIRPMWTPLLFHPLSRTRIVSIPQSGFDPCGLERAAIPPRRIAVSIPQSGFDPCGPPDEVNPAPRLDQFQSLSRDSTHVDSSTSASAPHFGMVSIPQSGFDPCGHGDSGYRRAERASFNPSVGIRPMWTAKYANGAWTQVVFQSLSRDSTHVDPGRLPKRHTVDPFQSLSRDSTHVDLKWLRSRSAPIVFQSLSRDSTHVDKQIQYARRLGIKVSIPQSGFDPCGQ